MPPLAVRRGSLAGFPLISKASASVQTVSSKLARSGSPDTQRLFGRIDRRRVTGHREFLYFECHDVGNFATGAFGDPAVKTIVNDTFLAGTLRNVGGSWLFQDMTAGSSSPLSFDHYYFP